MCIICVNAQQLNFIVIFILYFQWFLDPVILNKSSYSNLTLAMPTYAEFVR